MITAITPTGDRPEAFALCEKWMQNQTVKPIQWLVIDDGKTPLIPTYKNMQYIRREPLESDPEYTLNINLKTALKYVVGSKIIIIEDDDYYAPTYIEEISNKLDEFDLVGYRNTRYFHMATQKFADYKNKNHASLCQTAFKKSIIPEIIEGLNNYPIHFDMKLWHNISCKKQIYEDNKFLQIGIKGLPGRKGIGIGHNEKFQRYTQDENYTVLKKWLSKDYQVYKDIINDLFNNRKI